MLGFVTPWVFGAAVAASLATIALHFLSVRRPPVLLLPTARFIAPRDVRAVSRSMRPSDLVLLALRVLALLLAGAAVAGPRWVPNARSVGHVIVADRAWYPDSARLAEIAGVTRAQDAVVRIAWMDTSVAGDSRIAGRTAVTGMRAELGAAWPAVWSASAALLASHASLDSVAVHVMAPAATQSADGWAAWRASWPGRVRVHVRNDAESASRAGAATGATSGTALLQPLGVRGDDAVLAAFALHAPSLGLRMSGSAAGAAPIATVPDAGATGESRHVLLSRASTASAASEYAIDVEWPVSGVPDGWQARTDSAGALAAGGTTLVAPLARTAHFVGDATAPGTRVIAWWSDGLPAAVETVRGTSCRRQVGVRVPEAGDLLLSASARGLLAVLVAPCGVRLLPVPPAIRADSAGALAGATALRRLLPARDAAAAPWLAAALLGLSLLLLAVETVVRRAAPGIERQATMNPPTLRTSTTDVAA